MAHEKGSDLRAEQKAEAECLLTEIYFIRVFDKES